MVIVVWFSCGAASAVAAKLIIDKYGKENVRVVNNPIKEEHPDNLRFLHDVEKWLNVKIEFATNPKYPDNSIVSVFEKVKYMSGVAGAPCTKQLKKESRQIWESQNEFDYLVLGFTAEEKHRADRFRKLERSNLLTPLIDANMTKGDCFRIIHQAGIKLPEIYNLGYPNANCIGCVKAESPYYWQLVRDTYPEIFNQRAEQSKRIGAKLVKLNSNRIYLDELPNKKYKNTLKNLNIECGIFCEEN